MEKLPLTKAYLESLANADLLKHADNLGIDITQNPDRVFLIEELLEVSSLDGEETGSAHEEESTDLVFVESAPLPKYYNVTFIEVMIRDPFWAFVFWEIKASDKEQLEKAQDFNGYYLRVNLLLNNVKQKAEIANVSERQGMEEMLTVQVSPADTAWYVGFTPNIEIAAPVEIAAPIENEVSGPRYIVELYASVGETETVLAVSAPIRMPGLTELPKRAGEQNPELGENQLVSLSGYGDFHVLRRNERPLRAKKDFRS